MYNILLALMLTLATGYEIDSVQTGFWKVEVDGVVLPDNYTRMDKADAKATEALLNSPESVVRLIPPSHWTKTITFTDPEPTDPEPTDPEPTDPEPTVGFPNPEAISTEREDLEDINYTVTGDGSEYLLIIQAWSQTLGSLVEGFSYSTNAASGEIVADHLRLLPDGQNSVQLILIRDGIKHQTIELNVRILVEGLPPGAGFQAREPKADHIVVPAGGSIQDALDQGKDVLLLPGVHYDQAVVINNDGQMLSMQGTGVRPRIDRVAIKASNVVVTKLNIQDPLRNPDSPDFDRTRPENTGIYVNGFYTGIVIEDNYIAYHAKGIVLQCIVMGAQLDGCQDVVIRRNTIRYCWNKGDRGAGIYTNRVRGLRVEQNLIDHNGWHPAISGRNGEYHTRGFQAHGCYFSGFYNSGVPDKWLEADKGEDFVVQFHGNIVTRSSANGCQFRLGGDVTDNVFSGNPMAFYIWTNKSSAHRNIILNGTHTSWDDGEFWRRGWGMQIIASGEYKDNVIANVSRRSGASWAIVYESGSAIVEDNIFYNWRPLNKDSSIWDKNDSGLPNVNNNVDTIGGNVDAGISDEELDALSEREADEWSDEYDGVVRSRNLRSQYD